MSASTAGLPDMLYLSRADVEAVQLPFGDVVEVVRRVFREKGLGKLESPPKRGVIPGPGASIRGMMASIPSMQAAGVKWISAFPSNVARGWPTINALMILNDVETGLPTAVLDGSLITAMRTAASTLVAAEHMARPDSATVGLLACGLQGRVNLRGLCTRFPVRDVKVYDKSPAAAAAFAEQMGAELGLQISVVEAPAEVAREVDILVTSLPIVRRPEPPLDAGLLAPGSFAALLDYNSAMSSAGMRAADKLIIDDQRQLRFFRSIGYFRGTPEPDGDLGKVVAGRQRGRDDEQQTVIAINMGIGVLDVATASLVVARAREQGRGTALPL